ncbi:MAG: SLC13 family permease [Candidatus Cryptobacteroides sp.]|nr:SLC13 family permease [Bacteroidales bacterium]MDY2859776.1 SLC13 family permease [Candidatus Cryptobacteroides sp.]MDD7082421.1 SLC13 family permease [Bacteroidales bacterium]MDD7117743.1 SLC13 family permease [Bacteroidales bacterium]MDD7154402.1 SLC13 family permease [Bacteroidales bacterium]
MATETVKPALGLPVKKLVMLLFAIAVFLFFWFVPRSFFGIAENGTPILSIIEQRTVAIFALAALMWMFEVLPTWATSVTIIVLLLFTISDSSPLFMRTAGDTANLGTLVSYKALLAAFADPTIMLFLGGFILAIAATKVGLDVQLAKVLLKPFGTKPKFVLLGFLCVIALFSMFMSNTATAAMMLTFLAPVLRTLPKEEKGMAGLALAIPIAANVGGIGTPIGTPPNAIALGYLNETMHQGVGFGEWMMVMVPFVIVILLIAWVVLMKIFPFTTDKIELKIENTKKPDTKTYIVWVTFAVTILLWVLDKVTGINANVVAMIPVGVFCATGVITKEDLREIDWSVLWMVAGGFALGIALNKTGLAENLVESIPFASFSPLVVLLLSGFIAYLLSNFIANSAAANLLVPILCAVGVGMGELLDPVGGARALIIGVALSTSFAMLFPISTPPNAIAHSTGLIQVKDMTKVGLIIGVIGFVLSYAILIFIGI